MYRTALDWGHACEQRGQYRRARRFYLAALHAVTARRAAAGVSPPPAAPRAHAPALVRARIECLLHLGIVCWRQGRYERARRLYLLAGRMARDAAYRADDEAIRALRNSLAIIYKHTGRFEQAAQLYRRNLALAQRDENPSLYDLATLYHNLGGLEHARRRFADGEPFARKAVELREQLLGPDHPDTAADYAALAALLDGQGQYDEAESLYRRALAVFEKTLGPDHYELSVSLNNLAAIYQARGEPDQAAAHYARALAIKEKTLGPDHPELATTLNNLAVLRERQGDFAAAAELFARALDILNAALDAAHPHVVACRQGLERAAKKAAARQFAPPVM